MRLLSPAVRVETLDGTIENLRGEGLTVDWEIQRSNMNTPDTATITIWNLSPKLSGAIYSTWRQASTYLVILSIGWDGVPRKVIAADARQVRPNMRDATDSRLVLELVDAPREIEGATVGRSFAKVQLTAVLDYLVQLPPAPTDAGGGGLGLIFPPESRKLIDQAFSEKGNPAFTNLPAGIGTRDAIDMIMDTLGLEWRVQDGAFIALRGGLSNRPGAILRPSSGLVSFEVQDNGGIVLTALADPSVEPGIQVQVQDDTGRPFAEPVYRVRSVSFTGTSRGESVMSVEGARA